jgi:hypothetical protein
MAVVMTGSRNGGRLDDWTHDPVKVGDKKLGGSFNLSVS